MVSHEVDLILGQHLVHRGDSLPAVLGEEHERPHPDPVNEKLDQVRTGHVAAAEDPLAIPAEEMRGKDECVASPGVEDRAEETLRTVEDTVVVDDRVVPFSPLDRREHHPEPVPLLDGPALVVAADGVPAGLQHDRPELPQAVVQRPDRGPDVFMELPVDLLEGHRIDNHREERSGGVVIRRPDEQAFGRSEQTDQVQQLRIRLVEGKVVLVAGIGEKCVRGIDTDIKRVVGGPGLPKEPFQILRCEIPAERFAVLAYLELAVAVDLVQEVGELPNDIVQPGPEIPLDREITAGGVRRDLHRQDVDDPVGFVLSVYHRLDDNDETGDKSGRDGQHHADEGALDMEPVVVVGIHHVLRPFDHEMLVVAEPQAVQHESVEPVHDAPEGISREDPAPEGRAAVDVPDKEAQQNAEDDKGGDLLGIETGSTGTVGVIHETEGLAALDDGRGIVENALDGIPGHQEHEQREEGAGYEGFDEEGHGYWYLWKLYFPLSSALVSLSWLVKKALKPGQKLICQRQRRPSGDLGFLS